MRDGGTHFTLASLPSNDASLDMGLPPNPRRTHGRTGRATVTAGTLSPERYAVDGVAADPPVLDADADTLYGDGVESQGNASTEVTGPALRDFFAAFTEREAVRQGRPA